MVVLGGGAVFHERGTTVQVYLEERSVGDMAALAVVALPCYQPSRLFQG